MKYLTGVLAALALTVIPVFSSSTGAVNFHYNKSVQGQIIEGFGGGMVFHVYPHIHPRKDELYDSIFNNAGINIIRLNNWYNPQENNHVEEIAMLREIKTKWPHVKTMISSWSPPPYLKNNNSTLGNIVVTDSPLVQVPSTLRKNSDSTYMYKEYGDYWYKSIKHFADSGITFDWISIQNEPDVHTDYEGCKLDSQETPALASYGKALDAVYQACKGKFNPPVQLLGPDLASLTKLHNYLNSPETNRDQFSAYSHHLYDYPPNPWFEYTYATIKDKPIYQTEFLVNEGKDWRGVDLTWFDHAVTILNILRIERVPMYCIFSLAYKPASTHCFFSLDTLGGDGFIMRPTWYMFRHFSRSIHRGWHLVLSETTDTTVIAGCFFSPAEDSAAVVMINTGTEAKTVNYEMPGMRGEIRQTSDSLHYAMTGELDPAGQVTLPVQSISSLDFHIDNNPARSEKAVPVVRQAGIQGVTVVKSGTILIDYSAPSGEAALSLCDIRGREIARKKVRATGNRQHSTALLHSVPAAGIYTVTLTAKGIRHTQACVIHR